MNLSNVNWNASNVCRFIFPLILGFVVGALPSCKMSKSSGSTVKFRPPSWVFGVVWTILYILFGLAWVISITSENNIILVDVFYSIITVLLTSWIIVYSCYKNKKGGVYVLVGCLCAIILAFNVSPLESRLMISPLLAWIILATLLNTFEVQNL